MLQLPDWTGVWQPVVRAVGMPMSTQSIRWIKVVVHVSVSLEFVAYPVLDWHWWHDGFKE